jgi:ribose 5-phosphate isomerase A
MKDVPDHDDERVAGTKAAEYAVGLIRAGQVIGLGSGRAAMAFVEALASAVNRGLAVRAVPTSETTAREAERLGIPLVTLADTASIDVAVDGADEVDPDLDLIKGHGGASLRERVVEAAARLTVILVGSEKLVPVLGSHGNLPVEVVPFALPFCLRALTERGLRPSPRTTATGLFRTDDGNVLVDCGIGPVADPARLDRDLRALPGIVDTGFFLGVADLVLVEDAGDLIVRRRARSLVRPPASRPTE